MYDIQTEIHPHKYKQHENQEYGKGREFIEQRFIFFLVVVVCENVFVKYCLKFVTKE